MGFPDGAVVKKNPSAMQETWVRALCGEDPLEEGNNKPLQYSCLGNPTDRGAWWATVNGVRHDLATKTTNNEKRQARGMSGCSIENSVLT